ncbi:hypothetical protein B4N89_20485 [Embleya scabrispora]|uniref:Uncharacterized protein n=1 Tax=Embleya scabrispora TaxID=159449 RepID=A0A1T3P1L5_9ACTN|nr:hypothetical protein [Embleya scabrispora]OPC82993.1 hypothetical protein B4N89_20485 [Embleya scabrispora]
MTRRWYGSRPGDTPPPDDTPAIELIGGPLDGEWVVITGSGDPPYPDGLALIATHGAYDGGRSHYEHVDPPDGRLHWVGDSA